jgi:iron complex outermembrane receptor protein
MNSSIYRKSLLSLAIISAASASPIALAQVGNMLEEVIVTAQKREENLQDVPIAVTSFTGAQLSALGVQESFDIANFTPGVHMSGNLAGQNTQFSIRGVTQNDFNDIIEAPNAVYLDEGYIAIAQGQTFAILDIARVEILKGPQGTLFGRNATGGLVNYVSNKPDFENFGGYIDMTAGQFDVPNDANRYTVEAAVTGPLGDKAAGRLAVRYNNQDAYLENKFPEGQFNEPPADNAGKDLGDDDTITARGILALRPNDDVQVSFMANYAKSEVATGPYQSKSTIAVVDEDNPQLVVNVIDTPADETRLSIRGDEDGGGNVFDGSELLPGGGIGLPGRSTPGGDFFGYLDPDGDDFTFSGDFAFDNNGDTETGGLAARVDWDLANGMEFTSITDYKTYDKSLFIDVDAAPVNQLANYAGVNADTITQEFRLTGDNDRLRWLVGFYYLYIDNDSDNGLKAPENSIIASGGIPIDIGVKAHLETNSYNLFGQVDYELNDTLTLTVGARVIQEEKDFDMGIGIFQSFGNNSFNRGPFLGGDNPIILYSDDKSDTLWAGKIGLAWRPDDDWMLYADVNRGVKAGSFNAPLLGGYFGAGGDSAIPYDEEVLIAYEAGFKSTLGDGSTRLNGNVFYYDYQDYQAFLFVDVGGVVVNRDGDTYGAELELQTSPMDGLDLLVSASYFDATVKDVPLRVGSPLPPSDVEPTYAPAWQAVGMARYAWPALQGTMAVQGDVSYSDSFYYNLRNFDADEFDSYTLYNAQVTWARNDDAWLLTLAGRNLTDEDAGIQGFDLATLCGCNEVSYQARRYYSVGLRYSF